MSKKNYTVEITVTIGGTHTVSASSIEEAEELAIFEWDEADGKVVDRFAWARQEAETTNNKGSEHE
jgi:hypothetical protein